MSAPADGGKGRRSPLAEVSYAIENELTLADIADWGPAEDWSDWAHAAR